MAAIIYCWQQQQHVRGRTAQLSDISSGATCVADLDSGALALTKEASGNSREHQIHTVHTCKLSQAKNSQRTLIPKNANCFRRIENPRIMLLDCNLEYKKGESQVSDHLLFVHVQSDALKKLLCSKVLLEKEGSKSPYTVLV